MIGAAGSRRLIATIAVVAALFQSSVDGHAADTARAYVVIDDAVPTSLTGAPGDPVRGRAIVADRRVGLCTLCHAGPFPETPLQGNLAPALSGVGTRMTEGQLRLRLIDASRLNPETIMPPYYRIQGLVRVATAFQGKTILTAEQVEDVVAFLMTLRE